MLIQLLLVILGFLVLTKSADEAIKRLVLLSRHFGMSEFTISFMVVGIVSILPELSIGVNSAFNGVSSLGLGVILGSNIADLTLVVGMVALIGGGIRLHHPIISEAPWILAATALPLLLLLDGEISRIDGVILLAGFAVYLTRLLQHKGHKTGKKVKVNIHFFKELAMTLVCVAAILLSGMVITDSVKEISAGLAVPIFFIGVVLAIGTCLPELIFAITATNHHHSDLGVGDILGNVLADCMGVLGLIAIIQPIQLKYPQLALLSAGLMVLSILLLLLLFRLKKSISPKEGMALVLAYVFFLIIQTFAEGLVLAQNAAA